MVDDLNLSNWSLIFFDYSPIHEPLRDNLCGLGNGYFLSKGVCWKNLPGNEGTSSASYLVRKSSPLQAVSISSEVNNSLTEIPDWASINTRIDNGKWFNLNDVKIGSYQQELNLRNGILYREVDFVDEEGRHSVLVEKRFIHKNKKHIGCIQWSIKSINWSGEIEVHSNVGCSEDSNNSNFFTFSDCLIIDENSSCIFAENSEMNDQLSIATFHEVLSDDLSGVTVSQQQTNQGLKQIFTTKLEHDKQFRINKIASINHGRGVSKNDLNSETLQLLGENLSFDNLYTSHVDACHFAWNQIHLNIQPQQDSHNISPLLLARLQLFRLLQMGELVQDPYAGGKNMTPYTVSR